MFTIVAVMVPFLSFKFGNEFVGGIMLMVSGMNFSFYWTNILFGSKEQTAEGLFRKVGAFFAIITSIVIGILNYILVVLLKLDSNNFLVGTVILLPMFVSMYVNRVIFYISPRNKMDNIITFSRVLLIGLLVDIVTLGSILGLKFAIGG